MEIGFLPVTKENVAEAERLAVAPAQAGMVETVAECWAEALEFPLWRPVVLAADGVWVGVAMYCAWPRESGGADVWLDRFFIDARYQCRGLSKRFLPALMRRIRREYGCDTLYLSVYESNRVAARLYAEFGFAFNGRLDINGEKVMEASVQGL